MGSAKDIPWSSSSTLLEWCEKELREGRDEYVVKLIRSLPENRRGPYRELYTRIKSEQKKGTP